MIPPIRKTVRVPLDPQAAFVLFTRDLALWWPAETHSLSAQAGLQPRAIEVEERKGGKIREVCADGARANWATITGWEPGSRLALDWYVGRDPADATRVELRFLPDGDGTRVDLVHDGFDPAQDATRAQGYRTGWDHVLGTCFAGQCQRRAA